MNEGAVRSGAGPRLSGVLEHDQGPTGVADGPNVFEVGRRRECDQRAAIPALSAARPVGFTQ
jgi:hypothetical protein